MRRPRRTRTWNADPSTRPAKKGSATSHQIGVPPLPIPGLTMGIELFAWGDASQETASRMAGISSVKHSDYAAEIYLAKALDAGLGVASYVMAKEQ